MKYFIRKTGHNSCNGTSKLPFGYTIFDGDGASIAYEADYSNAVVEYDSSAGVLRFGFEMLDSGGTRITYEVAKSETD